MKTTLPEIRIKDAWLLRENASVPLNELWGDGSPLRTDKEYAQIVKKYQKAWEPNEQRILTGLCDILDLRFYQNIIDVYIAPWFYAFSDPLVIGVTLEPDVFVDTLTHELIHRLLSDNTSVSHELFLLPEWEKLFGDNHTQLALGHIPVHAVHKAILLDVLKDPSRLQRDIKHCKTNKMADYLTAWDYVEEHGHKEIINQLKQSYKKLERTSHNK